MTTGRRPRNVPAVADRVNRGNAALGSRFSATATHAEAAEGAENGSCNGVSRGAAASEEDCERARFLRALRGSA